MEWLDRLSIRCEPAMDASTGNRQCVQPTRADTKTNGVTVSFVDETNEIQSEYTNCTVSPPAALVQTLRRRSLPFFHQHSHSRSSPYEHSGKGILSPISFAHSPIVVDGVSQDPGSLSNGHPLVAEGTSQIRIGQLTNAQEALLLQHYIAVLGPAMDVCDSQLYFSTVAPELATTSPLLLNAALAASAYHLSRTTTGFDPLVAEMYHERCVELLIPLLDNLSAVSDEIVAATILLRLYEQMSSTGSDYERHLSGTYAFINATAGGIRQAFFWIFLRQDMDVALSHQRPLRLDLEAYAEMSQTTPSHNDDRGWANRIVWIAAEVVAFLFSTEKSHLKHEELKEKAEVWRLQKPGSFEPLFVEEGSVFPEVYYLRSWHSKFQSAVSPLLAPV